MKCIKHITRLFLLILVSVTNINAISMVYNFRIAQITKQPIQLDHLQYNNVVVALFFDQFRKKYNGTTQNYTGGLASYIYDSGSYYVRADGAFAHVTEKRHDGVHFSGTETDDILFTLGRNVILDKRKVITFSGLFGVPTHRTNRLVHADVGYSQVGFGVQIDGSYELTSISTLLYGTRFIYFVPRRAHDIFDNKYRFTLGYIGDLLLAYKNNWHRKHGIEFGTTLRSRFGAEISPDLDDFAKRTDYLRSNFYVVYKYKFLLKDLPNRLLFYSAYGFDHKSKIFGQRYILTFWTSWSVNF